MRPRRRAVVVAALAATVGLGLWSRRQPLPGVLAEHAGDALWTVAAYCVFAACAPAARPGVLAAAALALSAAVEGSQLLDWPWLRAIRGTPIGALLLGQGAKLADLVAYAVGAAVACAADATFRRAAVRGGPTADRLPRSPIPRTPRDDGASTPSEPPMRNLLLVTWLALPIGAWAYHEGPGQDRVALDAADAVLLAAHQAADAGDWKGAVKQYDAALKALPKNVDAVDPRVAQRLQIELNKARMLASDLPTAREELETLVDQMAGEPGTDPQLLGEAREALARSQFYSTWLMRLEGLDRAEWEPEIEAARQNYRLLAEQAGDPAAKQKHQGDVEAAIRLARMEIEDLQGLPLPSE